MTETEVDKYHIMQLGKSEYVKKCSNIRQIMYIDKFKRKKGHENREGRENIIEAT